MNHKEKVAYEKELEASKVVGIFSFVADMNAMTVSSDKMPFPEDVSAKLDYAGGLLTKGAANKYYSASSLVENGGEFYLIENHKYSITGDGGSRTFEREFIISKVGKDGKLKWTKLIPKNTVNKLNTFNTLVRNGSIYLFYLEHPKNADKDMINYQPEKFVPIDSYNGSLVIALELSPDGSFRKKTIFENRGWCYDPQPSNILMEKDNLLLLRMIKKGDERFDLIKVD